MQTGLIGFVILYLVASIASGRYAATRVRNATDYAVAGRSLPLYITVATVFAAWFGSETVLGIPATFSHHAHSVPPQRALDEGGPRHRRRT